MSIFLSVPVRRNKPKRNIQEVSAGNSYSIALTKKGRAWTWGDAGAGKLGQNNVTAYATPVSVVGAVKTFCAVELAEQTSYAIDLSGRVWGWGYNNYGNLGDNTVVSKRTPVSVAGATKTFCFVNSLRNHAMALTYTGRAWGWGINDFGQLGDNSITSRRTPVSVAGAAKTFCQISAGSNFSLGIDQNGKAWAWGRNTYGQLGDNTVTSQITPIAVGGALKTFCKIDAGNEQAHAIDKNGKLWCWGVNFGNALGDNTANSRRTPFAVAGAAKTFCKVIHGRGNVYAALALDKNGTVWGWGQNGFGQLGDNSFTQRCTPVSVGGAKKTFCDIGVGENHSIAVDKNGRTWCWGWNRYGQLGDNTNQICGTPMSIAGTVRTFCKINAGTYDTASGYRSHGHAIDKNGILWGWGYNQAGQLGDNTTTDKYSPIGLSGATKTFCAVAVGLSFSAALDKNGRAWAWGANAAGQLGDNTIVSKRTPVSILGAVKTFCQIAVKQQTVRAIDKYGQVWAWGQNATGQIGDNSIVNKCTPVAIGGALKTFCKITGGHGNVFTNSNNGHTAAIDLSGRAWGWGYNGYGQLGNNAITSQLTPVSVGGATKTFCQISGGGNYTVAIDNRGRAWGWGYNAFGQLGDNSVTSRRTPVSVAGATKTFCQIGSSGNTTIALDKNGRVWGWGYNDWYQIGIAIIPNGGGSKRTPVSVGGALKTFCQIAAGWSTTFAIDNRGRAWGWGNSISGALGTGFLWPRTPVQVCTI